MSEITRQKYLQLVGLLTLAASHNRVLRNIERAACEITDQEPDNGSLTSDIVYQADGEADADDLLRRLSITVEGAMSADEIKREPETPTTRICRALDTARTIERLRSDNAEMREVAEELLRLYDWRFELANEEGSRAERCVTGTVEWADDIRRMDKLLNQYGREKKAAWQRLRDVLKEK